MRKIIKNNLHLFLLIVFLIIILISHGLYVLKTNQYPEMDEQHYMDISVGAYRLLQSPTIETPVNIIKLVPFRQPGYALSILPLLLIFGIESSYKIALFLNGFYYAVTIFAVYLIGRYFFSKGLSLLSSFIFAVYGFPLFYLHFTYSETATTAFVVLSMFFLLKSNKFTDKKYSLLFGLAFGLGLLTRWVVPIFLAGPFFWTFYLITKDKKINNIQLKNIFFAILISVLISFLPYVINKGSFFGFYVKTQFFYGPLWDVVPSYRKNFLSLQSAAYYFKIFEQLNIFFFSIFVAGLFFCIRKFRKYGFLSLAFLVPYLIFSFGTIIKDDRYVVPIYPILALVSSVFLCELKVRFLKKGVILLVIILGIGSFLGGVWGIGPMGQEGLKSILVPMPVGHDRLIHLTSLVWPPTKNFSNADKIMEFMEKDSKKYNINDPYILNLFSYHPLDNAFLSINKYQRKDMYNIQNFVGTSILNPSESAKYAADAFKSADYMILKKGGIVIDKYFPEKNYILLKALYETLKRDEKLVSPFMEIKRFQIPIDNSWVIIFRRKRSLSNAEYDSVYKNIFKKIEKIN